MKLLLYITIEPWTSADPPAGYPSSRLIVKIWYKYLLKNLIIEEIILDKSLTML